MIILGIDPGTATTGCGLVRTNAKKNSRPILISYEKIVTEAGEEMTKRLLKLEQCLTRLIKIHKPDVMAVERLFFNTNAKTAMSVGQARGVIMVTAARNKIPFFEYTALQSKLVVSGYGRSDKKQMRVAVQEFLCMAEEIKSDDCADALAMAICHWEKSKVTK